MYTKTGTQTHMHTEHIYKHAHTNTSHKEPSVLHIVFTPPIFFLPKLNPLAVGNVFGRYCVWSVMCLVEVTLAGTLQ